MDVLVFDRTTMRMGGIEVYFAALMRYAISKKRRVIWLTTAEYAEESDFEITKSEEIEIAYIKRTVFGPLYPKLSSSSCDDVFLLTTDPCRFILSDRYRDTMKYRSFTHLLLLPHYAGAAYYPERIFKSRALQSYWHSFMRDIAVKLREANCIRGFSGDHLTAYESAYGIEIPGKRELVLQPIDSISSIRYDDIDSRERTRTSRFEIITCTRFDFPHKGYLLGLIHAFERIHSDYPYAFLTIVGYGPGEKEVRAAVASLSSDASAHVELTGQLSTDDYLLRCRSAHLCVGLAGALIRGAKCALPSIKMAHYTYECEGYGYVKHFDDLVPEEPARNMIELIEKAIKMPREEYIKRSVSAYNAAVEYIHADPEYIFRQYRYVKPLVLSTYSLRARILYFKRLISQKLCKRSVFEEGPVRSKVR